MPDKLTYALLVVGLWPLSYGIWGIVTSGVTTQTIDGESRVVFAGEDNSEALNNLMKFVLGLVAATSSMLPLGIATSSIYYEYKIKRNRKRLDDKEKEKLV